MNTSRSNAPVIFYRCQKVQGADGKQPWTELPPASRAPMHQFVDAILGKQGLPLVTPGEAAARVSVMEALDKGWRQGKWVKLA